MAYRRRQGISRASTFKEETIHKQEDLDEGNSTSTGTNDPRLTPSYSFTPTSSSSSSSSLAAQAIKASAARRDPSLSFAFPKSEHDQHYRSKSFDAYGDVSNPKSGFWGVLAQKAKEILEDDNDPSSPPPQRADTNTTGTMPQKLRSHSFSTFTPAAAQEGRTGGEIADNLQSQSKLNPSSQDSRAWSPLQQPSNSQSIQETQLKASRDVAMATAAKAKLLLRELKTVKADLAFAKARCAQLEEENKLLRDREGRDKGQTRADDDLIRLQLETLLAEKARLANQNEIYSRENRFLREIVEYHQLTMQDVLYLDEGMEDDVDSELYPIDTTASTSVLPSMSPRSPLSSRSSATGRPKAVFPPMPQEQEQEREHHRRSSSQDHQDAPFSPNNKAYSEDKHAK